MMSIGERRDTMKSESGGSAPYRYVAVCKSVALCPVVALRAAEQEHRRQT